MIPMASRIESILKQVRIPVSSLLQDHHANVWIVIITRSVP